MLLVDKRIILLLKAFQVLRAKLSVKQKNDIDKNTKYNKKKMRQLSLMSTSNGATPETISLYTAVFFTWTVVIEIFPTIFLLRCAILILFIFIPAPIADQTRTIGTVQKITITNWRGS